MHVCDAKFCDFFIYSKKGQILTRIYYNEQYSQELITAATVFFKHKLGPFYFEHLHSATSLHSPLPIQLMTMLLILPTRTVTLIVR